MIYTYTVHRHLWIAGAETPIAGTLQVMATSWSDLCETLNTWNRKPGNNSPHHRYYYADPQPDVPTEP